MFLIGAESLSEQLVRTYAALSHRIGRVQEIIDFASTLDWTNADDLQELLAMQEVDEIEQSELPSGM